MRVELTLNIYSFENVVFQVLGQRYLLFELQYVLMQLRYRVPKYSSSTLTEWFHSESPSHTMIIMRYFMDRTSIVLRILEVTEIVTKTALVYFFPRLDTTIDG